MNNSKVLTTLSVKATKESMLPIEKLEKLVGEPDSGIEKVRQVVHVALHPRYLNSIPLGLVNYFNNIINTYHNDLKGILAGYGRLQLKKPTGFMINEETHLHLDVQSDFWVFRPLIGRQLKGVVTKNSVTHVSCLVHGVFNVPCHKPHNLKDGQEWFGTKAKLKQVVHLKVLKTDTSQKVPFILGELQNKGLDGSRITFEETVPSPPVEELSDHDWSEVLKHDESISNEESSQKSKNKKSKAEKASLNNDKDKSDGESNVNDIDEQRKRLDSSLLNDSTASSSSEKKNKKKKRKDTEKDIDNEAEEAREDLNSSTNHDDTSKKA